MLSKSTVCQSQETRKMRLMHFRLEWNRKQSINSACLWFYFFQNGKKDDTNAGIGADSNIVDKRLERHCRQNWEIERFWLSIRKEEEAICDMAFLKIMLTIKYIVINFVVFSFYNITLIAKGHCFSLQPSPVAILSVNAGDVKRHAPLWLPTCPGMLVQTCIRDGLTD